MRWPSLRIVLPHRYLKLNRLSYEYAPTSTRKTSSATVNACSMKEATGLIIGLQEQRKEIYRATWFCRICEMASRRRRRGTGGQQAPCKFPYGTSIVFIAV